ncbi:MAG TPA: DUF222 domain-containing protein [Acidimicrobiales bacterium]|nr:DUF222 domain-containing protein [Acidimicrobiales bacterium]
MGANTSSAAVAERPAETSLARATQIEAQLAVIAGQENRLVAQTVALVAEALENDLCIGPDLPLARWVAWRFGCEPARAGRIAQLARRRNELPAVMAALEAGSISLDQAAVIARRAPAEHEADAVSKAEALRPSQLRRYCQTLPPFEDDDDTPARRPKRHHVNLHADDDGDYRLRGLLPSDVGAGLDAALRAQLDALWIAFKGGRADQPGDEHTGRPTRVDALARLAEAGQAAEASVRPHSQRTKTIIHVDLNAKVGHFHLGPAIPASVRRHLTCDSTFQVLFEAFGRAIGVGRTSPEIPARTRLVVEARDGGCRVHGCHATHVQIHHVQHWEDGGATETVNLIALCPQHHRAHHRGTLGISGTNADDPDGITFADARGVEIKPRPRPHPPDDLPPPPPGAAYHRPEIGNLSPYACVGPTLETLEAARDVDRGASTDPPPVDFPRAEPRLDRDGFPIDWPEVIYLDDDE